MEEKIKIAAAIAPVIIQRNFNEGRTIFADGDIIATEINAFTNKLVAKLHNIS